ncbi:hypothetical protein KAR48_05685 [bacterium]|nr:hypothetical protein [bacterium]
MNLISWLKPTVTGCYLSPELVSICLFQGGVLFIGNEAQRRQQNLWPARKWLAFYMGVFFCIVLWLSLGYLANYFKTLKCNGDGMAGILMFFVINAINAATFFYAKCKL